MDILGNCLRYTLEVDDFSIAILLFSTILMTVGLGSAIHFRTDQKRMSWMISLVNSFVLTVVGAIYLVGKIPTFKNFLWFGDNGRVVFHSLDNVSVLVSVWFTLANIFDLVFGFIFYRKYLHPLTAYAHHIVYIWILITGITGNGGFATFEPFAAGPVYMFIEELPTFLLALGSVFPAYRSDLGFGVSFFWLRLVYHAYMLMYSIYLGLDTVIPIMYVLTLALHVHWYHTWLTKYGWDLIFRKDKTKVKKEQ